MLHLLKKARYGATHIQVEGIYFHLRDGALNVAGTFGTVSDDKFAAATHLAPANEELLGAEFEAASKGLLGALETSVLGVIDKRGWGA